MRHDRWSDALHLLQTIASPDRAIVRAIAECKKKLGYQLTDAERKAARRWWPFGGSKRSTALTPAPSSWTFTHRSAALIMVVFGILGVLMIVVAIYHSTGVDVWFDSTLPRTTFIVDGHRLIADGPRAVMRLKSGTHHVTVLDRKGTKIEERSIILTMPKIFASVFDARAYVYNVGGQRVYSYQELEYSTIEGMGGHKESFIADPFFQVDGIDFMFTQPPKTVEVSSGTTTTRKALELTDWSLVDYAGSRLTENNFVEAEKAFRAAVKWDLCDVRARRGLSLTLALRNKADESVKTAKDGIAQCPEQTVEGHQAYQEALLRLGREEDALTEYRDAVTAHPDSALDHYLYGRLLDTLDGEIGEQRAAVRLDPHFGWAHCALGYALLGTGGYDEARHEYLKAMESDQRDPNAPLYLTYAAIASKHPEDIPRSEDWDIRWLAALSAHDWDKAWELYKPRLSDDAAWLNGVQMYKLARDREGFEKFVERGAKNKDLAWAVAAAHIEDALEQGNWREAMAATDAARGPLKVTNHLFDCYAAAAAMMSGDRADATRRLAELSRQVEADQDADAGNRRIAQVEIAALNGSMSEAAAVNAMHDDILLLKHVYFFLGARASAAGDAAHAKQLFRRSEMQSFDLDFPLLAARRLAGS
jgi:tetratricopeptide (TPR) repeat protein